MRLVLIIVFCIIAGAMARIQDEPLKDNEVLRVKPRTYDQVEKLRKMFERMEEDIDVWQRPSYPDRNVDFRLNKRNNMKIRRKLKNMGLEAEVMIGDVEEVVVEQALVRQLHKNKNKDRMKKQVGECGNVDVHNVPRTTTTPAPATTPAPDVWHEDYHELNEIHNWMDGKASSYSSIASVETIGNSYLNEPLKIMKIKTQGEDPTRQKAWIQCGIHAREWVSPATCIFMIDQILTNYNTDASLAAAVDKYDWYILPVTNPDGYKYTWSNNRMWRKTRSQHPSSSCRGADPNRNYPTYWGYTGGSRASSNPCSEIYHGRSAASEIEVQTVITYLEGLTNWAINIDIHSYSQMWLTPYGYTSQYPSDYNDIETAALAAVNALQAVHGTPFEYGPIYHIIYAVSGDCSDWAYEGLNVTYSYGLELRDTGTYGFLLPADQIIPTAEETMAGIMALADHVTP